MKKVFLAVSLLASTTACGGSDDRGGVGPNGALVGAPCDADRQCESRCAKGSHYPGGMCTLSCRDDRDCPPGTACVDDHGGVCALTCSAHRDCDFMGPRYLCDAKGRKGAKGKADVCRAP